MARTSKRTPQEIEQLLTGYEQSNLSRRQYCEKQGISVTTFDYYRQRQLRNNRPPGPRKTPKTPALVRVKLTSSAPLPVQHQNQPTGFTVVLIAKGRRIENLANFNEQDLARLIRVLEAA